MLSKQFLFKAIVVFAGGLLALSVGTSLEQLILSHSGNITVGRVSAALILGLAAGILAGIMFGRNGVGISVAVPLLVELLTWFGLSHIERTTHIVLKPGQHITPALIHMHPLHTDYSALFIMTLVSCPVSFIVWKIFAMHRTNSASG